MRNIYLALFILILVLYGCKTRTIIHQTSEREVRYHSAKIDSVIVTIDNTSFSGYSGVSKDGLYFFDVFFNWFWNISIDGEVAARHIGKGRGPDELPITRPDGVVIDNNNSLLITGASWDAYIFDNYKNIRPVNVRMSERNSRYEDTRAYTAFTQEYILKRYKDKFYYNVYMEHPLMNPVLFGRTFFKKAHLIMEVDIDDGKTRVLGNYSQHYVDNPNKLNHWFGALYDLDDNGNFHVSFQADSLIYEYNNHFELLRTYGFEGLDMDTDYKAISGSWESVFSKYEYDKKHRGYYYWIKHIPELDLTFRSYHKSSKEPFDGLQIYEDGVLVGDIDVPKKFKVVGYIEPYFVTEIEDRYENEVMQFYRFSLQ